ncbi:Class E vacuolar protein-sorting machinery protein [Trichinella spiralis]|uniref:Class E vacuolar protein-sorting machinery protein n=1 Tax=Trichinella spiralis TaxID=6334 RepID=A0ABR3KAT3_TRISP
MYAAPNFKTILAILLRVQLTVNAVADLQTKTKSYTIDELDVTLIDGLDHWNCKIENEMLKSLASQSGLCLLDYAEVLLSALCDEITAEAIMEAKTKQLHILSSWNSDVDENREIMNLKEALHSLETRCVRLKQERSQAFADLKQVVETKRSAENELIAKFEKILNEKKKRIRELEDKQLFNIQQSTDSQSDSASSIELFTSDQLAPFRPGTSTCATNFLEDKDKSDSNIQKTTP